jgi:hypothetical protein
MSGNTSHTTTYDPSPAAAVAQSQDHSRDAYRCTRAPTGVSQVVNGAQGLGDTRLPVTNGDFIARYSRRRGTKGR